MSDQILPDEPSPPDPPREEAQPEVPFAVVSQTIPSGFTKGLDDLISQDLVARARRQMHLASTQPALDEHVEYGIGLTAMPGPQGEPVPILVGVIAIKSLVIGQRIQATVMVQDLWADQRAYDEMMRSTVEQLRTARSQMAAGSNGHGSSGGFLGPLGG